MTRVVLLIGHRGLVAGAAALLIAALVVLVSHGATWIGTWKAALDTATGSLVLVGPVAAGWAALTYSGLASRRVADFAASTVRGRRAWLSPALVIWFAGCLTVLLAAAIATGVASALGGKPEPASVWILGEAFAVLAAQVSIGAVIGSVLIGPWAAPIAASAVFALCPLSVVGPLPGIFDTGSVAGSLVGQTWSAHVLVLQAAVGFGIAVVAGCLLVSRVSPALTWGAGATAFVAAGLTIAAWSALESGGHERYIYESSGPEWVCSGDTPRVCLDAETARPLAAVSAEMHRQAAALVDAGVELPETFDQLVPGAEPRPGHGAVEFLVFGDLSASADPDTVARSLATPTDCPEFSASTPPTRALGARVVVADWIAAQAGTGRPIMFGPAEAAWLRTDSRTQERWIVQAYDALATCRFGDLRLPF